MGMAASQARFLGLTARKNNNEYQAQQINQQKLDLAREQEDFTRKYSDALANTKIYYFADGEAPNGGYTTAPELTYWNIVNPVTWSADETDDAKAKGLGYRVVDANGNIVVPNYPGLNVIDDDGNSTVTAVGEIINKYSIPKDEDGNALVLDNDTLQENIKSGSWTMKAKRTDDDGNEYWEDITYDDALADGFIIIQNVEKPNGKSGETYERLFNTLAPKINGEYQELSYKNLLSSSGMTIRLYDEDGKILADELPEDDLMMVSGQYRVDPKCIDSSYLAEKLKEGEWFIQQPTSNSALSDYETIPWQGIPNIYEGYDTSDDSQAEAEYETQLAKFERADKLFDMQLKQLETEHKALETELDSVSKVIEDNVNKSFKTFSA